MIVDDLFESPQTCPECGGPAFSDLLLAEKKDACYHKVRSRYKVWPSAYASGALVQCRKKGAANWGNKSEGVAEGVNDDFEQAHHSEVERYITAYGTPGEYRHKYDAMGRAHNSYLTYPGRTVTINTQQYGDRFGHNVFTKKEGVADVQLDEKCWDTHRQAGMKKKGDRMVPNCVPKEGVEEAQYDRGDYYNAYKAGEYGRDLPFDDDRRGHGASRSKERDGRDDHLAGQSTNLPADPFGRTTGAVPKAGIGRIHNIALPGEIDEADKIGNMDADDFDAAMSRLKKLAGQGPLKTVWDPVKRVYRNVPVAVQPKQQPGK